MPHMTLALWIIAACASAAVMAMGSRVAIGRAATIAHAVGAPPFLVGMTLLAVGTDIPEIVNSIVAAYAGHGDITLGDATGSVFTQITFGLGLFPFMAGVAILVERRNAWLLSALTVAGLALSALLFGDGVLSQMDAVSLLLYWCVAATVMWNLGVRSKPLRPTTRKEAGSVAGHATVALLALGAVGAASAVLVGAVAAVSSSVGVPEYVLSFFGAAIATSLPEIAVEFTALRRGERDMALGDVFGSCLVDASLAIAAGPLLFATQVTPALAYRGTVLAAVGMIVAGTLLGARRRHDRSSGAFLLACYVAAYFVVFTPGH
jgi:cation:H+ antiporter